MRYPGSQWGDSTSVRKDFIKIYIDLAVKHSLINRHFKMDRGLGLGPLAVDREVSLSLNQLSGSYREVLVIAWDAAREAHLKLEHIIQQDTKIKLETPEISSQCTRKNHPNSSTTDSEFNFPTR